MTMFVHTAFITLNVLAFSRVGCNSEILIKQNECNLPEDLIEEIASYSEVANQIINATLYGQFKRRTYDQVAHFVDKFGNRFTGTDNLENSIDFMLEKLKEEQLDNVHGETVEAPHWIRNHESAYLIKPRLQILSILGLGSSIATPPEGIQAEAIVVDSFEDLQNKTREQVHGKIVVFVPEFVKYGTTVKYRTNGASEASKLGAVAVLVRSITPFSMSIPHTGWQTYYDDVEPVPTAAISIEDAHMLQRMRDRGDKIVIKLKMEAQSLESTTSRNVVADLRGTTIPEKMVIVSGHIDSWDIGQGAMDDAGGAFASWNALVLLKSLNLRAKRTIRSILWTAEEVGLVGARSYARNHEDELDNVMIALESDEGTFTPQGLIYVATEQGGCILQEILKLLEPINATSIEKAQYAGSDIIELQKKGVPTASVMNENDKYFWFHHSSSDTMDVENPDDLDKNTVLFAVVSYVLADLSIDFPRETDNHL